MQSVRLIVKNAVLWVMFLASMAASVFFSFDSHFNAIFPAEQRKRAAEIRTTNQIGGVISDIGALTQKRQIEEAERLFDTEGWKAYDKQLTSLGQTAQGAQGEIEKYFVQQMEERRRAIAQQQERMATAQSGPGGAARERRCRSPRSCPGSRPSVRRWRPSTASTRASSTPRPRRSTPSASRGSPRTAAWRAR